MIRNKLNRKRSRAAGILEFVLVLPFFLLLMMLVVDLGRTMMVHTEVNSALNATARIAAVQGGASRLPDGLEATFNEQYTPTSGVSSDAVTVDATGETICSPGAPHVSLEAEFSIDLITPFLDQIVEGFTGEFTVGTTAVARCEVIGN